MKKIVNTQFQETRYEETLENGLHVILWHKPDYQKSLFMMATPLSALDIQQRGDDGHKYTFPAGIAHFLEHKMFEMKDGDVMEEFSKVGANVNAFTSYTETAYYFSTSEDIEKPLNLLLDFVQRLDITNESVEKEKGIIIQELHMYKEMSDSRLLMELYASIFQNHPLKYDIGGNDESVTNTTLEDLYTCYNINYHPSTMVLVGVSASNPSLVMEMIKANQAKKEFLPMCHVVREKYHEPREVARSKYTFHMDVSIPKVAIALKLDGIKDIKERIKNEWAIRLLLDATFTNLNPLFQQWLDKGIFNDYVGADIEFGEDFGIMMFYAETLKEDEFCKIVDESLEHILRGELSQEVLEQLKKRYFGQTLRYLNGFEDIAISSVRAYFEHSDFFDGIEILSQLTLEDVKEAAMLMQGCNQCKVVLMPEKK